MKYFSSNKLPIFLISLLCLILITIWFKDGKFLATGEEGLMLINPDKAINLYKYSWNDIGSGEAVPVIQLIPFFYFESFFIKLGLPLWIFQASIFYLLMSLGSLSVFLLCKELFKDKIKANYIDKFAFVAALFYILNPISMLGIWYRFLLVFMFFYALAPLFFYLFAFGINRRKKTFILLVPLISLLFTFSFGNPATVLLLWVLPFIYSLSLSLQKLQKKSFNIFPILYFTVTCLFWILINLWWIFSYIELSQSAFASENTLTQVVNTLKANSVDFTLANVIRLIHGGFLYRNEEFGSIYKTPIFLIFSWLIPAFTIYGLFKLKSGLVKSFFIFSFISLLYLVKGTAFPFGGIFLWFFKEITLLHAYRNPLEKIGMLLPIIYAPLFSYGLFCFLQKIQNVKKKLIVLIVVLVCLAIFHWPLFSGALVSFGKRDIRVVVPSSFQSANLAIPKGNHIILSVPVMGGASGFYKWQYGYKGVDGSEYLFNYPVITKFYDKTAFSTHVLIALSNGSLNNLLGVAQFFSADIVVFRKDTDIAAFGYNLDALERSQKMIDRYQLVKIFDSPELSLWKLPEDKKVPLIYTPSVVKFGKSAQELISSLENNQFDPKNEVFVCTSKDTCNPYLPNQDISKIYIDDIPESIEFKKVSPVKYDIKINNSKGKFILVFNNSYHQGWTALVNGKLLDGSKHFVANGYANGFLIDNVGNLNISLQFAPETRMTKVYKISFIGIIAGIIILTGAKIIRRN